MTAELFQRLLPLWLAAFGFTLLLELPVFVLVGRWRVVPSRRISVPRLLLAGAAGTCLTHPLLWFVWPLCVHGYTAYIVSGELLVASIETGTFFALARPLGFKRALAAAWLANATSYGLGAAAHALGLLG